MKPVIPLNVQYAGDQLITSRRSGGFRGRAQPRRFVLVRPSGMTRSFSSLNGSLADLCDKTCRQLKSSVQVPFSSCGQGMVASPSPGYFHTAA